MNWRRAVPGAITLSSLTFAISGPWMWNAIFFRQYSLASVIFTVATVCALAFMLVLGILGWFPWADRAVKVVIAASALVFVYVFFRPFVTLVAISAPVKLAISALIVAVAVLIAYFVPDGAWRKVNRAIVAFAVVLSLSPPLIGRIRSYPPAEVFNLQFVPQSVRQSLPIVLILLDEASPEMMNPVVDALRQENVAISVGVIEAAGRNTLNAVPAMLAGHRFDRPSPCWRSILCDDAGNLDFARLRSTTGDVDVIGYYIPYCSIAGLRTCQEIPFWPDAPVSSAGRALACGWLLRQLRCEDLLTRLSRLGGPPVEAGRSADENRPRSWRGALIAQLDAAPFWTKGGLLYLHIPLPHLEANSQTGNLHRDYRTNVDNAAALIGQITNRLRRSFAGGFMVVVTSDHPLRVQNACNHRAYTADQLCGEGLPINRNKVSFIVAGPRVISTESVTSGVGLLR